LWSGLVYKGQVIVPASYTTGTVTVVTGSNSVQGVGTAFTSSMVGEQFRVGFTNPIYTINQVNVGSQVLTLDLPYGGTSIAQTGYQIFQNLVNFGPNLKYLFQCVNQKQGYAMQLNVPQNVLNIRDTWRTATGWTYLVSDREMSPAGIPQKELYPIPTFAQSFPFLAYAQPPDLNGPEDFPYPFIRSDVIVLGAIADALVFRGKNSKYYDPQTSMMKRNEQALEMQMMGVRDNEQIQKDLIWEFDRWPLYQMGADFFQTHDAE